MHKEEVKMKSSLEAVQEMVITSIYVRTKPTVDVVWIVMLIQMKSACSI